jgi:hypothetical protein
MMGARGDSFFAESRYNAKSQNRLLTTSGHRRRMYQNGSA